MLSTRVQPNLKPIPLYEHFSRALSNVYHPHSNPTGIISLGIAENSLMHTELTSFLQSHLTVSSCQLGYAGVHLQSLYDGLVNLFNCEFRPAVPVLRGHVYLTSGVTALLDQCFWSLCDEGDGVLVGRPLYGGFIVDMSIRAKLRPVGVSLKGVDPFSLDAVQKYEEEYLAARKAGVRVRVLLLCNPHNPLGQ